ncbi:hypothetical protein EVA_08807 [gut metagenome]|uniref:Uncharacterized protein n=1 Tax=gut metagenome TaxID=749906 RepID=J9G8C4_9ZZZZ
MNSKKYMLLINGQDKTDSVVSFRFQDGMGGFQNMTQRIFSMR